MDYIRVDNLYMSSLYKSFVTRIASIKNVHNVGKCKEVAQEIATDIRKDTTSFVNWDGVGKLTTQEGEELGKLLDIYM